MRLNKQRSIILLWPMFFVGLILSISTCLCAGESGQSKKEEKINITSSRHYPIFYILVGGSGVNPKVRNIGGQLPYVGWETFVKRKIEPLIKWAGKDENGHPRARFWLHNPWGLTLEEKVMRADQYLLARKAGLNLVTQRFVEAWKPITQEDIEVVAYLGKLNDQESMGKLTGSDWFNRAFLSYQLPIQAGMSIGFDSFTGEQISKENYFRKLIESLGIRTYIEPRPRKDQTFLYSANIMSIDSFWKRSDPDLYKDSKHMARTSDLSGEIVRLIVNDPQKTNIKSNERFEAFKWEITQAKKIADEGHTPLIYICTVEKYIKKMTYEEVFPWCSSIDKNKD